MKGDYFTPCPGQVVVHNRTQAHFVVDKVTSKQIQLRCTFSGSNQYLKDGDFDRTSPVRFHERFTLMR